MMACRWLATPPDLHELRVDPVRCMILPSGGCGLWGWRAGWDGVIWRGRLSCRIAVEAVSLT